MAEFVDLGRNRFGIAAVAGEYLDGDRASFDIGEQAEDDLRFAGLMVARVAEVPQGAVPTLKVSGGQIAEHEAAVGELPSG